MTSINYRSAFYFLAGCVVGCGGGGGYGTRLVVQHH